ncbi:MAG TPA: ABC transporter permease, partial [Bacteroidales bacterium]
PNLDKSMQNKIISNVEGKLQQSDPAKASVSPIKMTSIVGERKDRQLFLIQSIAGVAIMMLLFSISGLSTGLLDEKESGTLKRLLYSPLKPTDILFGKMLTAITISIAQLAIMFLYAKMAFGLNISQNIPALVLMIISTAFAVSGIGMFLASISKTRAQAQGLGTLTILTMSALGGSMVPLFVMPAIMQKIALFTVNYWGIQGFYDIFWRGLPTIDILPRVIVLLGIGLVLTLVSVNLFNRNVRQLA